MSEMREANQMSWTRDRNGNFVLIQWPNVLLWLWIICTAFIILFGGSQIREAVSQLGRAALFAWSYLETTQGVTYIRRGLGAVVLVGVIISFFTKVK